MRVVLLTSTNVGTFGETVANSSGSGPEVIADYTAYDFEALWPGREKVTRIETALLRRLLGDVPQERLLEIGTGFGRLTPTLRRLSKEYVGVDLDSTGLARARATVDGVSDSSSRWVLANLHHLPFAPGTFSAVVMVRLAHHLPRWEDTTRQLAELLQPGGRCVVTVFPTPTVGTLAEDVKGTLRDGSGWRWGTFARGENVHVTDSPHPKYLGSRKGYRSALERAGLRIVASFGSGLEELVPGFSSEDWVKMAPLSESLPFFPMKWYAALRPGPADKALPPLDEVFVCPRCRAGLRGIGGTEGGPTQCASCRFEVRSREGQIDLRYLPEGVVRIGPALTSG